MIEIHIGPFPVDNVVSDYQLHVTTSNPKKPMIKRDECIAMRANALCFKPFLIRDEGLVYFDLDRLQFAKRYAQF